MSKGIQSFYFINLRKNVVRHFSGNIITSFPKKNIPLGFLKCFAIYNHQNGSVLAIFASTLRTHHVQGEFYYFPQFLKDFQFFRRPMSFIRNFRFVLFSIPLISLNVMIIM